MENRSYWLNSKGDGTYTKVYFRDYDNNGHWIEKKLDNKPKHDFYVPPRPKGKYWLNNNGDGTYTKVYFNDKN